MIHPLLAAGTVTARRAPATRLPGVLPWGGRASAAAPAPVRRHWPKNPKSKVLELWEVAPNLPPQHAAFGPFGVCPACPPLPNCTLPSLLHPFRTHLDIEQLRCAPATAGARLKTQDGPARVSSGRRLTNDYGGRPAGSDRVGQCYSSSAGPAPCRLKAPPGGVLPSSRLHGRSELFPSVPPGGPGGRASTCSCSSPVAAGYGAAASSAR